MALVFQSTSSSTPIATGANDDLVIRDFVDVYSAGAAVTLTAAVTGSLVNHGNIFGNIGVQVDARFSRVVNYGTITGINSGITGEAINLAGDGTHEIVNLGIMTSERSLIEVDDAVGDFSLLFLNQGTAVSSLAIVPFSTRLLEGHVNNAGYLRGSSLHLHAQSDAVLRNTGTIETELISLNSATGTLLVNSGVIAGTDTAAVVTGFSDYSTGILLGGGDDVVLNSGTIFGRVNLAAGNDRYEAILDGHVSEFVAGSTGNDTLAGGNGDEFLSGGNDQDIVMGRGGDDTIWGGAGFDTLFGGEGRDSIEGGTNNDTINGNAGDDTLFGDAGHDVLVGQDGSDLLDGGALDDILDGGNGDDVLEGGSGNDILRGRAGEDNLAGGLGLDLLTGGQDADSFVFRSIAETVVGAMRDQIMDFEQGLDTIVVAGLSPGIFEFKGTGAFAPSGNPELRLFETPTGSTIVQLDNNGDGIQDAEIRVANVTGLTAEDFVL